MCACSLCVLCVCMQPGCVLWVCPECLYVLHGTSPPCQFAQAGTQTVPRLKSPPRSHHRHTLHTPNAHRAHTHLQRAHTGHTHTHLPRAHTKHTHRAHTHICLMHTQGTHTSASCTHRANAQSISAACTHQTHTPSEHTQGTHTLCYNRPGSERARFG